MAYYNNFFLVNALDHPSTPSQTPSRRRIASDPCLPERLPSNSFLQREADQVAPKAILRQLRRSPTPPSDTPEDGSEQAEQDENQSDHRRERTLSSASEGSTKSIIGLLKRQTSKSLNGKGPWKDPQPYEVLRAVERKDVMFLMEIRDRAFHLLLRKCGDVTPLLHAMRIGKSHNDVAIILLGAFSRYINHLTDGDLQQPKTRTLLKALRANLKIAIDYGLAKSQSDLIASFMQTLIMSEGDKWIMGQINNIGLALRAGTAGEPVKTASAAVRKFATRELGKADLIASFEDYVANATADLLILGAWSLARDSIQAEPIPLSYFARDDRVQKAFVERLDKHEAAIRTTLSKRLKWQFRVLRTVLEGRNTGYRTKIDTLSEELDQGDGV
ncbi:hypothetical protein K435DRAFT_740905 [Dendrothele bispora CBS 962.96]|uniref:Uncharacterized protein n=1 Tax=Dendrothele bispora (strain CBS 962.96) TaxID=1314807 RepID=A0A4S8N194_DENBC|nr:hypothetical protein K435DRAFT_740905 [Dendrothele bispora CBS 962.96]